jgi:organic solute transporter Ostalpha
MHLELSGQVPCRTTLATHASTSHAAKFGRGGRDRLTDIGSCCGARTQCSDALHDAKLPRSHSSTDHTQLPHGANVPRGRFQQQRYFARLPPSSWLQHRRQPDSVSSLRSIQQSRCLKKPPSPRHSQTQLPQRLPRDKRARHGCATTIRTTGIRQAAKGLSQNGRNWTEAHRGDYHRRRCGCSHRHCGFCCVSLDVERDSWHKLILICLPDPSSSKRTNPRESIRLEQDTMLIMAQEKLQKATLATICRAHLAHVCVMQRRTRQGAWLTLDRVPIYSIASWTSMISLTAAQFVDPVRDIYEAGPNLERCRATNLT